MAVATPSDEVIHNLVRNPREAGSAGCIRQSLERAFEEEARSPNDVYDALVGGPHNIEFDITDVPKLAIGTHGFPAELALKFFAAPLFTICGRLVVATPDANSSIGLMRELRTRFAGPIILTRASIAFIRAALEALTNVS